MILKTWPSKSKSSIGKSRKETSPTAHLDDLLLTVDADPHQLLKGDDGKTAFVILTADHYHALRDALHDTYAVAVTLDPAAEFMSMERMRLLTAGADVAQARKAKGWTQAELARRTGIPQSQVSRIERNPDRTTVRTLKKLAAALGVDVANLIAGS